MPRYLVMLFLCARASDAQVNQASLSKQISEFESALHLALNKQRPHEEDEDKQRNENKNQGLINTIVNHNNQLKVFENKFNLVVNNLANSSHVKEVHERTKELEKHLFGAPQPHKSWRELLLLAITLGALGFVLLKLTQKYVAPCWTKWLNDSITNNPHRLATTISEQVSAEETRKNLDLKLLLEQHLANQKEQLEIIAQRMNGSTARGRLPALDVWNSNSSEPNRNEQRE